MDISAFLPHLMGLPFYREQVVHVQHIQSREPRYGDLDSQLHSALQASLESNGLLPLYNHQATAVNSARDSSNVVVVTPAASGKTLCYNIPVIDSILSKKGSRALYLYPTKALAQDQMRALGRLTREKGIRIRSDTFDGDTPQAERPGIRKSSDIVLTNPDMLHVGILPNHRSWSTFLSRLQYVVVDEAHVYRGVFGSHVGNVLRRLRRLCGYYGSRPQFILASATIANPGEHAESLTGLPFEVVAEDGSPYGGKDFIFWNPPIVDEEKAERRSPNVEATAILTELVLAGIRSLGFAKSRRLTELIYLYVKEQLKDKEPALAGTVMPYRAGYLAEDRRQIERDLFEGLLNAVIATNALELGVDIGDLDATVLNGYPGSIASTWQQAGRSGRSNQRSLSFLVGRDDPLDQYLMRNPEFFFDRSHEHALTNPGNLHILEPHLLCAAWEMPISDRDVPLFGDSFLDARSSLEDQRLLRMARGRWHVATSVDYPAQDINIRSSSSKDYALVEATTGRLLERVDDAMAFFQIHPGAMYLHQGESYLVTSLDLTSRTAYAIRSDEPYYTQTRDITEIRILDTHAQKEARGTPVYLGEVEVTTTVLGFKKKRIMTDEVIGEEPLDLPPSTFSTVALWFDIPEQMHNRLSEEGLDFAGGLHAAEHGSIALLPLFALCDRNDIGGVSTPLHLDTGRPQVFIYDGHPGGTGIAEKGYELVTELWEATRNNILECPCQEGCPSCIQSPKCGNNNEPLDKRAAVSILGALLSDRATGRR